MTRTHDVSSWPTREQVTLALDAMQGEQWQQPPAYSARKVDGERSYRLARRGEAVALAPSRINVRGIALLGLEPPFLEFRVTASAGTYVRSLGRDLGIALGTGGHLVALHAGIHQLEGLLAALVLDPGRGHEIGVADVLDGELGIRFPGLEEELRPLVDPLLFQQHLPFPGERAHAFLAFARELGAHAAVEGDGRIVVLLPALQVAELVHGACRETRGLHQRRRGLHRSLLPHLASMTTPWSDRAPGRAGVTVKRFRFPVGKNLP